MLQIIDKAVWRILFAQRLDLYILHVFIRDWRNSKRFFKISHTDDIYVKETPFFILDFFLEELVYVFILFGTSKIKLYILKNHSSLVLRRISQTVIFFIKSDQIKNLRKRTKICLGKLCLRAWTISDKNRTFWCWWHIQ